MATIRTQESNTILTLRKKLKRQDDVIRRLQQDNTSLRSELELEQGITQMYVDRLQRLEEQWIRRMRTLKGFVKDVQNVVNPTERPDSEINNESQGSEPESYFEETSPRAVQEDYSFPRTKTESQLPDDDHSPRVKEVFHSSEERSIFSENSASSENVFRTEAGEIREDFPAASETEGCSKSQRFNVQQAFQNVRRSEENSVVDSHRQLLDNKKTLKSPKPRNRLDIPGLDWTQRLLLIRESYEKRKALFVDDLSFIQEVQNGVSLAPEMDIEAELKNLARTFRSWKTEFKEELRSAELQMKHSSKNRTLPNRKQDRYHH